MTRKKIAITIGAAIAAIWAWRSARSGGALVPTVTTSEGFDLSPYGGPTTYPAPIKEFANAIAHQEGFFVAGSIPQRAHNPGDLVMPNWAGPTLGAGISVFDSDDAGWHALYRELWLVLTGQSGVYNLDMTIADMANKWTATQKTAWANNVANYLGVNVDTPLWTVLS